MNNLKQEYLNYLEMLSGKREHSVSSFFRKATDYEKEYGKEIEKFNSEDVENFLKFYARTSPNSLSVYVSRLKKYYNYLADNKGITSLMQYTDIKYQDYKDLVEDSIYNSRLITREELYASIGKIVNPCDRLLLLLIFLGIKGDKNIELLNLKKSDIDLNSRHILVNGKHYNFDSTIESELRNTMNTDIYYMNNGQGDTLALQRKNRVHLVEQSDYIFRPIEPKLGLKRDMTTLTKLTSQSIQKRVLAILHHILDKPNMTLQTLYTSGVVQKLVDTSKVNGEMTNKEVREWIDANSISVTKQEVYKVYAQRLSEERASSTVVIGNPNQLKMECLHI